MSMDPILLNYCEKMLTRSIVYNIRLGLSAISGGKGFRSFQ